MEDKKKSESTGCLLPQFRLPRCITEPLSLLLWPELPVLTSSPSAGDNIDDNCDQEIVSLADEALDELCQDRQDCKRLHRRKRAVRRRTKEDQSKKDINLSQES